MLKNIIRMNQDFLDLLIKEHNSGKIDWYVFTSHSQVKLQFLKKHINYIHEPSLKSLIQNTINACEEIFRRGNNN